MAQRDFGWYHAEAQRIRSLATTHELDAGLSDNYLRLAAAYETLAGTLERTRDQRVMIELRLQPPDQVQVAVPPPASWRGTHYRTMPVRRYG